MKSGSSKNIVRGSTIFNPNAAPLTPREHEVLGLLGQGRSNKDIADALSCSVRTVEFHISNLLRKLGVSSRLELVTRAEHRASTVHTVDGPALEIRLFSGMAAASLGDTMLLLWRAPATFDRWRWSLKLMEELARSHEQGVSCQFMVAPTSLAPDRYLQAAMAADLGAMGGKLRSFVGVPLGDFSWKRVVHTVMQATFAVGGQTSRLVLGANVDHAITQVLETGSSVTPRPHELRSVTDQLIRLANSV